MVTAGASTFRLDDSGGGFVVVMARWSSDRRAGSPVPIRDTGGHGWRGHGVAWRCEFGAGRLEHCPFLAVFRSAGCLRAGHDVQVVVGGRQDVPRKYRAAGADRIPSSSRNRLSSVGLDSIGRGRLE